VVQVVHFLVVFLFVLVEELSFDFSVQVSLLEIIVEVVDLHCFILLAYVTHYNNYNKFYF
jgi:hypothetical protein